MNLGWAAVIFFHFCLIPDSLLIVESTKVAMCWLCQVVGGVVIHSAASLILLWGGFPCQEAPAWPPAHQPHLAPAYRRPTAHALALRVGGESRLAGFGTDTFWQALLSPHSTEWSADCNAEHKKAQGFYCLLLWPAGPCGNFNSNIIWNCSCLFDSRGLTVHPVFMTSVIIL